MMQNIQFDDGCKSYMINNDESKIIRVNISDLNIHKRYEAAKDKMFAEIDRIKDSDITPEDLAQADKTIRDNLNCIFGSDICTAAFGQTNVLSMVSGGKLLIESFLDAFLPMITADIKAVSEAAKISLEDKTAKYIAPVTDKPVDVDSLTPAQKKVLLEQLIK